MRNPLSLLRRGQRLGRLLLLCLLLPSTLSCDAGTPVVLSERAARVVGQEAMYRFMNLGSRRYAQGMLVGEWTLTGRLPTVEMQLPFTWREDPFNEKFWRFIFYSLRFTRHILFAYDVTGYEPYKDLYKDIIVSFLHDGGAHSVFLEDEHTTSFLVMSLVNAYARLASWGMLEEPLADEIEAVLTDRCLFLMDEKNFQGHNNHGITQAAALVLVGHLFPHLEGAEAWKATGVERLLGTPAALVAADGVQVEQTPFYHHYTWNFFWELKRWNDHAQAWVDPGFGTWVDAMEPYATHSTLPDGTMPGLSASLPRKYPEAYAHLYEELKERYPNFRWLHSDGVEGEAPTERFKLFETSGWAFFHSPFDRYEKYSESTHVAFDIGPYRTGHSQYDALNLHLYAERPLLVDSGLYTLEENEIGDYYWSTPAHNTVSIDGLSQRQGSEIIGPDSVMLGTSIETADWLYQSARHDLYDQASHARGILMLDDDRLLVIDRLQNRDGLSHDFEAHWHLAPDLEAVVVDSRRIVARDASHQPQLAINHFTDAELRFARGQLGPRQGWVATGYEEEVPAMVVGHRQHAQNGLFVTLLSFRDRAAQTVEDITVDTDGQGFTIAWSQGDVQTTVTLQDLAATNDNVAVTEVLR